MTRNKNKRQHNDSDEEVIQYTLDHTKKVKAKDNNDDDEAFNSLVKGQQQVVDVTEPLIKESSTQTEIELMQTDAFALHQQRLINAPPLPVRLSRGLTFQSETIQLSIRSKQKLQQQGRQLQIERFLEEKLSIYQATIATLLPEDNEVYRESMFVQFKEFMDQLLESYK